MTDYDVRTEELIAAAAAGDLSADEQAELDTLRAQDPSIDATLRELTDLLPALKAAVPRWKEASPPSELDQAVNRLVQQSATASKGQGPDDGGSASTSLLTAPASEQPVTDRGPRRRKAAFALAAAGCLVAGSGATVAVQHIIDSPPDGPPGTYGAVEDITFSGEPSDVNVDGSLIAHTWGTETVLEIDGLEPGESFTVVLVAEDGQEFASGTFFGSEVLIECRMNAAVMRDDVERVEITADDGDVIAQAELPEAIDPEAEDPEAEAAQGR